MLKFINAVLENSKSPLIKTIVLKNPFNLKNAVWDKESILDIKATDESGKTFNIEMQSSGDDIFKNRSLFYWARLYSSQLKEGEIYKKLSPAICINILDFKLFKDFDKYHSTFMVREMTDPDFFLTDHLAIHFLELPKLKSLKMEKKLENWLYYLKNEGTEDEKMKILLNENQEIKKAHEQYLAFTNDEELVDAYEAHMKWQRDFNSGISNARKEGKKEGEKEGKVEGEKNMLIEALEIRFEFISEHMRKKIINIESTQTIKKLFRSVFEIESLSAFDKILDKSMNVQ
ncbi:MAG: Rpn family recombination-promoting nuclease/putative transposase [Thermodesulfobacteriota bacterium]|nr:Rpn family recombination-promoting nuclease/putative transposase [Thermodesulfobacteriota bacterium]